MATGKNTKIGLGVAGVAALIALVAFGLGAGGEPVLKEEEKKKEDEKKKDTNGGGGGGDGGEKDQTWDESFSEEEKQAQEEEHAFFDPEPNKAGDEGNPPNISRDGAGYDTSVFKSFQARRQWYVNLGYGVNFVPNEPIKKPSADWTAVKKFISDYNTVAKYAWFVYGQQLQPSGWMLTRMGHLASTANPDGKNISNAISVAAQLVDKLDMSWNQIVNKAKALKSEANA